MFKAVMNKINETCYKIFIKYMPLDMNYELSTNQKEISMLWLLFLITKIDLE